MTIPIIDTHQHLIDPALGTYAWTRDVPELAGRAFDDAAYRREIEGLGIAGTVFMETTPDAWRGEAGRIYALAEQPGSLLRGVVAGCRPEEDGFEEYLDSISSRKLSGLRRICHIEPDDFSRQPKFRRNLGLVARRGLTFDLCFSQRQLPIAAELVRAFPAQSFILNHCGGPDIASGRLDPWRGHVRELAALPNLACKISGLVAYCRPGDATLEIVRPYVEHCLECFGWDRVVWGGDWPVCTLTSSLRQWVEISRALVASASASEQRRLFHENATRLYRLEKPAAA